MSKLKRKAERNASTLQRIKKQKVNKCKNQTKASFEEVNEKSTITGSTFDDECIPIQNLRVHQSRTVQAEKLLFLCLLLLQLVIGLESRWISCFIGNFSPA